VGPRFLLAATAAALCWPSPAGAFVYWGGTSGSSGAIGRSNLDATSPAFSFIPCVAPMAIAVDGQHVYWIDGFEDSVGRANLDGSNVIQNFITGANSIQGIAVDGEHIYWTSFGTGAIGRANLDSSGVNRSFITGATHPVSTSTAASAVPCASSISTC
jgi:virginiamycin B lyase